MADEKLKIAGLRLKIDGAAEFNKSITSVNNELKLASANLSKVTAEFNKNTPAVERLAAKQQDYANKLEAARKKGEEYQRVLASVKAQYGENSEEVMRAETLVARNEAEQIKLQKALENVTRELEVQQSQWTQYGEKAEAAGKKISNVGDKITNVGKTLTAAITAPLIAAGAASFKFASDMEESINKVEVAFQNSSDIVKEFAQSSLTSFGISEGEALDAAATFGDMATSMGLSTEAAAEMATSLVGLSGDLASFKNIGIEEANTALKGIFTGETESLKTLGIVMTETQLAAYALENGITDNVSAMSQADKVMLRYQFILDSTKNAQGDFARTSDGAANQMRIFTEGTKELATSFGQILLPIGTKAVTKLNELLDSFNALSDEQKENILRWAGIAAAIGPVTLVIGKVTGTVGKVVTSFGNLSRAIGNAGGLLSYIGGHPIKTAVTAFAGIVTVTGLVGTALDNLDLPINNLRNSIDDNAKTVKSLSEEFDNLIAKQSEVIESGLSETEYLEALKLELDGIVDSNGKIQEGYEKRAQFIIGKLSEATGVEITAVDGVIQKYDDLTVAIDDAIAKKRAMIILEGKEEAYTTAIQNLSEYEQAYIDAYHNMQLAQEEYDKYGGIVYAKQLEKAKKTVAEMSETLNGAHEIIRDFETTKAEVEAGNFESVAEMYGYVAATQEKITALTVDETKKQLEATKTALEEQVLLYKDTGQEKYQLSAEQAAQELALLVSHLQAMGIEVDQGTLEMLKEWQEYFAQQATDQENANNESIDEQEEYMEEFDNAIRVGGSSAIATMQGVATGLYGAANSQTSQFSGIGSDMMSGIASGIRTGQSVVNAAISGAVQGAMAAGQKAAESNSPSKKAARELGAPISQGIAVGIASETPLIEKSLRNSMIETFSAAKSWTVNVQTDLNSRLSDFTSALSTGRHNSVTTNNAYNYEYGGITVQNMVVREESDIKRIAKELFAMQRAANRGQGVVMP